jgi:hypothetical protein
LSTKRRTRKGADHGLMFEYVECEMFIQTPTKNNLFTVRFRLNRKKCVKDIIWREAALVYTQ